MLFIVRGCGLAPRSNAPAGTVRQLRSQTRLQALDFWVRNPDYLADELLDEYEAGARDDALEIVRAIYDEREPDLRRLPMARYLFGAYEPLDDALSLLVTGGLLQVRIHRFAAGKVGLWDYFLMEAGERGATQLVAQWPEAFRWYDQRAQLVATVAGRAGGSALKKRQYLKESYKDTPLRQRISPISDRVLARLEALGG